MPHDTVTDFRVEELTRLAALEAARSNWTELWRNCPRATPFQSPAWLIPWWQHFGGENKLRTLLFRDERRLIGLAPLFVYQPGPGEPRQLTFIGSGISDYLDILSLPGCEAAVANALFDFLNDRRAHWDVSDFQELKPDSALLSAPAARDFGQLEPQSICPVLSLTGYLQDSEATKSKEENPFVRIVPKTTLEKLRYYQRRIAKAGAVQIETASAKTFPEFFDAFLRLHANRWRSRGEAGVLSDDAIQNFHREAASKLLQLGALRLYVLKSNSWIIGALYCFHSHRRTCYYLSGFDPGYAQFSPGTLLIGHALEAALQEGATEFDFLRGQEKYKYTWGAEDRTNQKLKWRSRSAAER